MFTRTKRNYSTETTARKSMKMKDNTEHLGILVLYRPAEHGDDVGN